MAKKKANRHQEEKQEENALKPHNKVDTKPSAMAVNNDKNDASAEKLESLKSLNAMLLKEAVERRQQVDSLVQAKGCLESELTRSNSEKEGLESELTRVSETFFRLELERNVVFEFVARQVGQQGEAVERERDWFWREKGEIEKKLEGLEREMREVLKEKSEINEAKSEKDREIGLLNEKMNALVNYFDRERDVSRRTNREREELKAELHYQTECSERLRAKMIEMEGREKRIKEEVEKLEVKCKGMVEEKKESERRIEAMLRENDLIEGSLVEANRLMDEMRGKFDGILKEKEGIAEQWNREKMKGSELESAVSELNETVLSLQEEQERLKRAMAELEKKCVEGEDRLKEKGRKIDELVGEKEEREKRLERLVEEKGLVENDLNEALKRLGKQKLEIEQLVNEKIELAEGKDRKERTIVGLQKEVQEFRDAIRELENSYKGQMEKMKDLESEVGHYKDALKQVRFERDEARKDFDEAKQNGLAIQAKSEEMEKNIYKNVKLVEELKANNVNIIAEKKELESRCEMLKKEVASTENALAEVQKELDDLRSKVKLAKVDSERILSMLMSTTELVCPKDGENVTDGKQIKNREATEPYVLELELIKDAFKNKESKVEDMKQQLVILQNSVVEANKKKSFWTLLSSATTLFAAISIACIARVH